MIVITGAAGFIGSCLARSFNEIGVDDLLLVDDFSKSEKDSNLKGVKFNRCLDRTSYIQAPHAFPATAIFHIGARTDTTEFNKEVFDELNLNYSKAIWNFATSQQIPLIYASSAATYGDGKQGFDDKMDSIKDLAPLNPYGQSKQDFDLWALSQKNHPPFWCGLKFFNVFGPNEYHKGRMASVVYQTFNQIRETGQMKLFKSHHPDFADGEQSRDFVYIKDVINVIHFWFNHQKGSGIYNLGTGIARSFKDLATAVFKALDKKIDISYIPHLRI